jgi:hypothetical protein
MFQTAILRGKSLSCGCDRIFSKQAFRDDAEVSVGKGMTVPPVWEAREEARDSSVDAVRARMATARPEEAKARAIPAPWVEGLSCGFFVGEGYCHRGHLRKARHEGRWPYGTRHLLHWDQRQ